MMYRGVGGSVRGGARQRHAREEILQGKDAVIISAAFIMRWHSSCTHIMQTSKGTNQVIHAMPAIDSHGMVGAGRCASSSKAGRSIGGSEGCVDAWSAWRFSGVNGVDRMWLHT